MNLPEIQKYLKENTQLKKIYKAFIKVYGKYTGHL